MYPEYQKGGDILSFDIYPVNEGVPLELVASGVFDPAQVLTKAEPITDAIEAYKQFDQRRAGWIKVELAPGAAA